MSYTQFGFTFKPTAWREILNGQWPLVCSQQLRNQFWPKIIDLDAYMNGTPMYQLKWRGFSTALENRRRWGWESWRTQQWRRMWKWCWVKKNSQIKLSFPSTLCLLSLSSIVISSCLLYEAGPLLALYHDCFPFPRAHRFLAPYFPYSVGNRHFTMSSKREYHVDCHCGLWCKSWH